MAQNAHHHKLSATLEEKLRASKSVMLDWAARMVWSMLAPMCATTLTLAALHDCTTCAQR